MKIIQVTPGVMPIPPKGWGAVEKIIWEYKKQLDFLGYETEIRYCDEVTQEPGQIVHVHMANLANLLHERGIEYAFSLHDHHSEHFGKDSDCYRENHSAIKNAKVAFVHSPHLIEWFDSMPNIVYLPHGANLKDYEFVDRSGMIRNECRLLMMANNGLGGDKLFDRKGFLIGIEAAKSLGYPITIMCPGENREFFEHHRPEYDKLDIRYDVGYEDSIRMMREYSIFLNPSYIEAGHPNLTVTECVAMGLPVVGTSFVDVPGLVRCERDAESLRMGIIRLTTKYDTLVEEMREKRYMVSWDIAVNKMLQCYKHSFGITEKAQLEHIYSTTRKSPVPRQEKPCMTATFKGNKAFLKTSVFSEGLLAVFRDTKTNRILFKCDIGKEPGQWAYMWAPHDEFIEWEVSVQRGTEIVFSERLDLKGKRVLIKGEANVETAKRLTFEAGCFVTLKDVLSPLFCHDPQAEDESFYITLNEIQLEDYFSLKPRQVDRTLFIASSSAIGDTISFVPYANEWARQRGQMVDIALSRKEIFDWDEYPYLFPIDKSIVDENQYNRVYKFEYLFDRSLQRGYSDQLGLEYKEIPAVLKKSGKPSPMKKKYVCLGVQTTSQCKYWNHPGGWEKLTKMIKKAGYEVVAVDRYEVFGIEGHWNNLPDSAIKKVEMEFSEAMRYIEHCEVFIGVSSGLSWTAYGLGKKVVMISGTTSEDNEFTIGCKRVINKSVCHGCFNKPHLHKFNPGNWLWCPKHIGTDRMFECTKTITPEEVFAAAKEMLDK